MFCVCACAHRRGNGLTSTNLLWRMFIVPMARRTHCKGTNKDIGRLVGGAQRSYEKNQCEMGGNKDWDECSPEYSEIQEFSVIHGIFRI